MHKPAPGSVPALHEDVFIPEGSARLPGAMHAPEDAFGWIVFAHGSGSSRFSPRNNQVAHALRQMGLGTLLLDLLTPEEDADRRVRFDIDLLARRLGAAVDWLRNSVGADQGLGLFGASTGAAAALRVAAMQPDGIGAIVSRGGRPDLAGAATLAQVQAPTLLIVGGLDDQVIELNEIAASAMTCHTHIEIVEGATHLFEEPGTLEQVAVLAQRWFVRFLAPAT